MYSKSRLKVVVVGGGFGGVKAALMLIEEPRVDVTLISENKDFRYHPSLYHAATGGYHVQTVMPLAEVFENKPVNIVYDSAKKIDRKSKKMITKSGKRISYDRVIFALGAVTNYFGIKGLAEYSYGIKNYEEANQLKEHLHNQLIANHEPDVNYIVVGGGPTGVEIAGALPAYIKHIMRRHKIKRRAVHIELVEASPRILPSMPKDISRMVAKRLRRLGVKLYLGTKVEGETANDLIINFEHLKTKTVIWTAGVRNHPFFKSNNFKLSDNGRVIVDEYLAAETDIYVIGDNADTPYSGMAQTAVRDADLVASNIHRQLKEQYLRPYKPKKPVYVTPCGRRWATVLWGKFRLYGRLGWFVRRFADLWAYRDMEVWWKATQQWWAEYTEEEHCPYCAINNQVIETA